MLSVLIHYQATPFLYSMASPHSLASRIQALALAEYGVPVHKVSEITTISVRHIYRLRKTARGRGFDPAVSSVLKEEYVKDAPRSGRPKKVKAGKDVKEGGGIVGGGEGEDGSGDSAMRLESGQSLPDIQHMDIRQLVRVSKSDYMIVLRITDC